MAEADLILGTLDDSHQVFVFLNIAGDGESAQIIQDFDGVEFTVFQNDLEVYEAIAREIDEGMMPVVQLSPAFVGSMQPFLRASVADEEEWCHVTFTEQPAAGPIWYANAGQWAAFGKPEAGWYWFYPDTGGPKNPYGPFESWTDAFQDQAKTFCKIYTRVAAGMVAED